nr:D-2-hydroxyacid dehydrogenase [Maliibacterium massiliense]
MRAINNVLVVLPVEDAAHQQVLRQAAPQAVFTFAGEAVTQDMVREAEVIIGNPPAAYLAGAEKLRWLQLNSAGADAYIKEGALPAGVALTNATGAYGLAISEHMLGMMLMLMKKLHLYHDNMKENRWRDEGMVRAIDQSTVLVVGMGDIGGAFAQRCKAMGAKTIGVRRANLADKPDYIDELYLTEHLDALLPQADVVALSLPGTKATYKMFDRDRIARMKEGAILLNVGRGTVVDTDALCDALVNGHLAGAGIDVTDPEPLPAAHPLWQAPNCIITPHVSGGFHLQETYERILRIAADNMRRFQAEEPLQNQVDFATGYRRL